MSRLSRRWRMCPEEDGLTPSPWCTECEEPCESSWQDEGIGRYEFWGFVGNHVDWRELSECCGAEVTEVPYEDEEDEIDGE